MAIRVGSCLLMIVIMDTQLQCQVFPLFINVIRVLQVNIIKSGHWKRFETYGEHHDQTTLRSAYNDPKRPVFIFVNDTT